MKDDFDPDAPPSHEELAAAEELRLALEDPSRSSADAELARALAVAHSPRELDPGAHATIVSKALATERRRRPEAGSVIKVWFGAAVAVAAVAAMTLLWLRGQPVEGPAATNVAVPLVQVRSTAPLFHEPFDVTSTSARVDRIALARADDYRENMYAQWGVK